MYVCVCVCVYKYIFSYGTPSARYTLTNRERPCLFGSGLSTPHVETPPLALQGKTGIRLTLQPLCLRTLSPSVVSDSLRPHGLYPTRLLSKGFSRQEQWSGLSCPPPGDLPDPGIKPASLMSPALAGRFFTTSATGKPYWHTFLVIQVLGHWCRTSLTTHLLTSTYKNITRMPTFYFLTAGWCKAFISRVDYTDMAV